MILTKKKSNLDLDFLMFINIGIKIQCFENFGRLNFRTQKISDDIIFGPFKRPKFFVSNVFKLSKVNCVYEFQNFFPQI